MVCLPGRGRTSAIWARVSTHRGHGVPHETLVEGRGLDVGGDDDSVLPEVQLEGIPGPTSFGLHDVKGHAAQEIFKRGPDPDPMSLQRLEACRARSVSHSLQEFGLGRRAACACRLVREQVGRVRWLMAG